MTDKDVQIKELVTKVMELEKELKDQQDVNKAILGAYGNASLALLIHRVARIEDVDIPHQAKLSNQAISRSQGARSFADDLENRMKKKIRVIDKQLETLTDRVIALEPK